MHLNDRLIHVLRQYNHRAPAQIQRLAMARSAHSQPSETHQFSPDFWTPLLTLSIAAIFALCVLWQTLTSWSRTKAYLKITAGDQAANAVITSDLPLFSDSRSSVGGQEHVGAYISEALIQRTPREERPAATESPF